MSFWFAVCADCVSVQHKLLKPFLQVRRISANAERS